MVHFAHITGNSSATLYALCAAEAGQSFPIQYDSTHQNSKTNWPDPVSYLNVTGTGTLTDHTTGDTFTLPLTISDVVNSISLQNLIPSSAAMVVTINSK